MQKAACWGMSLNIMSMELAGHVECMYSKFKSVNLKGGSLRDMGIVKIWDMLEDTGSEGDTGMCPRGRLLGCSPSPFPHKTKI